MGAEKREEQCKVDSSPLTEPNQLQSTMWQALFIAGASENASLPTPPSNCKPTADGIRPIPSKSVDPLEIPSEFRCPISQASLSSYKEGGRRSGSFA